MAATRVVLVYWESAGYVKTRDFVPGQAPSNVIHPDRGLLVSFSDFQRPVFSRAHVIVGDEARFPAVVLVQIKPRAARVDDDCVLLILAQLQQIARYAVRRRPLSVGSQAGECFGPQSLHVRPGGSGERHGGEEGRIRGAPDHLKKKTEE